MTLDCRFIYTGIRVRNMEESLRFYTKVLGMTITEPLQKTPPTKGSVVTLRSQNSHQLLELNHYEEDSPFNSPYINGEDLDHLAFDVRCSRLGSHRKRTQTAGSRSRGGTIRDWKEGRMERSLRKGPKRHLDRIPTTKIDQTWQSDNHMCGVRINRNLTPISINRELRVTLEKVTRRCRLVWRLVYFRLVGFRLLHKSIHMPRSSYLWVALSQGSFFQGRCSWRHAFLY